MRSHVVVWDGNEWFKLNEAFTTQADGFNLAIGLKA